MVLRSDVVDPDGRPVIAVESPVTVAAGTTVTLTQVTDPIATPRLWHPEHPHLYRVVSTLRDGPRTTDRYETSFGFRWFSFSATTGFTLNGKHHYPHDPAFAEACDRVGVLWQPGPVRISGFLWRSLDSAGVSRDPDR